MPSKTVVIRREEASLEGLPKTVARDAKKSLSSVYQNGRPLTVPNVDSILEGILGLKTTETGFIKAREKFWKDITLKVPFGGRELEVGLDSAKKPINPEHFLIYHWALKHPLVATSSIDPISNKRIPAQEMMARTALANFCIIDNSEEKLVEKEKVKSAEKAAELYFQDRNDEEKVKTLVRYLAPGTDVYNIEDIDDVKQILFELHRSMPDKYVNASTDKNIAIRSEVANMREAGILTRTGNTYIYIDETIGNNEDQVVAWFKNPRNSKSLLGMRAKLDEYMTNRYKIKSVFDNDIAKDLEVEIVKNSSVEDEVEALEKVPADMMPGTDAEALTENKKEGDLQVNNDSTGHAQTSQPWLAINRRR